MMARPELETVKAMLVDVLGAQEAKPRFAWLPGNKAGPMIGMEMPVSVYGGSGKPWASTRVIKVDELAATVLEWFAAHYEPKG